MLHATLKTFTILKLYRFANDQPEIICHLYLVDLLLQTGSESFHSPQKHVRVGLPSRVSWEALHVYDIAMVHSSSAFGSCMDNSTESSLGVDVEMHLDKHIPMLQSAEGEGLFPMGHKLLKNQLSFFLTVAHRLQIGTRIKLVLTSNTSLKKTERKKRKKERKERKLKEVGREKERNKERRKEGNMGSYFA